MHQNYKPAAAGQPDRGIVEQHYEVCRGESTLITAGPLAGKLNDDGFPMIPDDCGFDGQLFPLRGDEFFEVSVAVTESVLSQKYRLVVCSVRPPVSQFGIPESRSGSALVPTNRQ